MATLDASFQSAFNLSLKAHETSRGVEKTKSKLDAIAEKVLIKISALVKRVSAIRIDSETFDVWETPEYIEALAYLRVVGPKGDGRYAPAPFAKFRLFTHIKKKQGLVLVELGRERKTFKCKGELIAEKQPIAAAFKYFESILIRAERKKLIAPTGWQRKRIKPASIPKSGKLTRLDRAAQVEATLLEAFGRKAAGRDYPSDKLKGVIFYHTFSEKVSILEDKLQTLGWQLKGRFFRNKKYPRIKLETFGFIETTRKGERREKLNTIVYFRSRSVIA